MSAAAGGEADAAWAARVRRFSGRPPRPLGPADDPVRRENASPARPPAHEMLACLVPPPLLADLALTNKVSQNLDADLMLRRLGRLRGTGSIADGLVAVRAMLDEAGRRSQ